MHSYNTLSEAIAGLQVRGYSEDFNLQENGLHCRRLKIELQPDEFEVIECHRFDDDTNPDDESVLYGIISKKYGVKGILVNSYSIYSDDVSNDILRKLKMSLR